MSSVIACGMCLSSATSSRRRSTGSVPRTSAIRSASRYIAATWATNVFVAATLISSPARVSRTPSASRVAWEPMMLVRASTVAPRRRARRMAASVSADSPDWVMPITRSPGPTIGLR